MNTTAARGLTAVLATASAMGCSSSGPTQAILGTIALQSSVSQLQGMTIGSGSVQVVFNRSIPGAVCTDTTVGACTVDSCVNVDMGAAPPATKPTAGAITITGLADAVMLAPGADGLYPAYQNATHGLWSGGETVAVSASGGEVAAFSTTLTAPSQITVSMPTPSTNALVIQRAADFTAAWSGGGSTQVEVYLAGGDAGGTWSVRCYFPASAGSGTIPAATLGMLPSGSAVGGVDSVSSTAIGDGLKITIRALQTGILPDGTASGMFPAALD